MRADALPNRLQLGLLDRLRSSLQLAQKCFDERIKLSRLCCKQMVQSHEKRARQVRKNKRKSVSGLPWRHAKHELFTKSLHWSRSFAASENESCSSTLNFWASSNFSSSM